MSWIFSKVLMETYANSPSSPGLAEAFSAGNCSDGEPSARSKMTPTHGMFWSPGKTTDASPRSRSGIMYEPLKESHGAELLTWYLEAFHVRTSHAPVRAPGLTANARACGAKWRALSVKFDPVMSGWKTYQASLFGGLVEYSGIWPRWGMIRAGELWERTTPVLPTGASESGLWPTPNTEGWRSDGELAILARNNLTEQEKEVMTTMAALSKKKKAGLWPTPRANEHCQKNSRDNGIALSQAVKRWPTPRAGKTTNENAETWQKRKNAGKVSTPPLTLAGRVWPTPKSRDWKGQSQRGIHAPQDASPNMDRGDGRPVGGSLNPSWVAWLMGWPFDAATGWDWTSMDPAPGGVMESMRDCWREEPAIPRVITGAPCRVDRLKCLGNGQVSAVVRLAWELLR